MESRHSTGANNIQNGVTENEDDLLDNKEPKKPVVNNDIHDSVSDLLQ